MIAKSRAASLGVPLLLALAACPRAPELPRDPRAPCASLDHAACERARALVIAATTYADEQHDVVLAGARPIPAGVGLARTPAGWRSVSTACARATPRGGPKLDASVVEYAFAGIAIDGALVAVDADLAPLLGEGPATHDVKLVAIAFARDLAPPSWEVTGDVVVHAQDDSCTCADATHFAGATKYGATLAFQLTAPRDGTHERAVDFVRRALGDPRFRVRESNTGLAIDGLASLLDGDSRPLAFHLRAAAPVAYVASPLAEACAFPTPDVSPASIDFGVAAYGSRATRAVHVVNRAAVDLEALVGADTVALPAHGAIDLALSWTPDGDALRCETQTRDDAILFVPAHRTRDASASVERRARVFETIRTGRPTLVRSERIAVTAARAGDYDAASRDWTCPADFLRTSCRAENVVCSGGRGCATDGFAFTADARGEGTCHFACRGPSGGKTPPFCRFDAVMECALHCP